jgi:hypothetical protein
MIIKLGKVDRINVRKAWANEASHFTPWLASEQGIELLQEALGLEMEVEATEKFVGPFKADILAKRTDTTDDHWVLIENQLERTDHRHLGQLLTYAAGLKAATIVWVAERFEEQHRAALDWLNEITSDTFEFYGLEVELWQIDNSSLAPMFNLVAKPNEWSREVKQKADDSVSDLKQKQRLFWQGLRELLLAKKSKVRPQKAHPQHWSDFALGRSGAWLSATVNKAKQYVSVEFSMRGPPGKVWFTELEAHKAEIEAKIGPGVSWQRLDGRKSSRVAIYREQTDPTNEADWPAQHAWLVEKLELFDQVFRPLALGFSDGNGAPESTDADQVGPETD